MRISTLAICLIALCLYACKVSQQSANFQTENYTMVFYNVENLFDTEDDPGKKDEEFMPSSEKEWTAERYEKKLDQIAGVIADIDASDLPELIGLCEIENRRVLKDLKSRTALSEGNYQIVHIESEDIRGIDVAFLYKKNAFNLIHHRAIKVEFEDAPDYKSRDVLYVKGTQQMNGDTLHIFINHWPSRRGGQEKSESKRMDAAFAVKQCIDSIQKVSADANIIVTGDFNDYPDNKSIAKALDASGRENSRMVNLGLNLVKNGEGSYNYRGNWGLLDQFIVSRSMVPKVVGQSQNIYKKEAILYKTKKGYSVPSRTYGGNNYYGGYSDHLPVYIQLSHSK